MYRSGRESAGLYSGWESVCQLLLYSLTTVVPHHGPCHVGVSQNMRLQTGYHGVLPDLMDLPWRKAPTTLPSTIPA